MKYAQFFTNSTGYVSGTIPPKFSSEQIKPIEACGSDGVLVLDGRWSDASCAMIARQVCKKRGFVGFTLNKGKSFSRSWVTHKFEAVAK